RGRGCRGHADGQLRAVRADRRVGQEATRRGMKVVSRAAQHGWYLGLVVLSSRPLIPLVVFNALQCGFGGANAGPSLDSGATDSGHAPPPFKGGADASASHDAGAGTQTEGSDGSVETSEGGAAGTVTIGT